MVQRINNKPMILERVIDCILIFKRFFPQLHVYAYFLFLAFFLHVKEKKEGNSVLSPVQYVSAGCLLLGELLGSRWLLNIGMFVAICGYLFVRPVLYELPYIDHMVDLQHHTIPLQSSTFTYWQCNPVDTNYPIRQYKMRWNTGVLDKILQRKGPHRGSTLHGLAKHFMSYVERDRIPLCEGTFKTCDRVVVVVGKSNVPVIIYSSLIRMLGGEYRVIAVEELEEGREAEGIKEVAGEKQLIFIAVEEGTNTVLRAYQSLRERVHSMIFIDPFLQNVQIPVIQAPMLCLTNQYSLTKAMFGRIKNFIEINRETTYICLSGGDQSQTDLCFVFGSTFYRHKNLPVLFSISMEIMLKFLEGTKGTNLTYIYYQYDLGTEYEGCNPKKVALL